MAGPLYYQMLVRVPTQRAALRDDMNFFLQPKREAVNIFINSMLMFCFRGTHLNIYEIFDNYAVAITNALGSAFRYVNNQTF